MSSAGKKPLLIILSLMIVIGAIICLFGGFTANAAEEAITDINSGWTWPLSQNYRNITSGFGVDRSYTDENGGWHSDRHQGIDISSSGIEGQPIYAARKGTVVYVGVYYDCGNMVSIRHGTYNGATIYTTYMHMKYQASVSVGQEVDTSTVLGFVGGTGTNGAVQYGVHLHFQICKNSMNPTHNDNSTLYANYYNPSNMSYTYLERGKHKLTINYYSNYADTAFSNPLNAVGPTKSVLVKKLVIDPANVINSLPSGLHNYTTSDSSCYLRRTYYTGTGDWNTAKDGSGISVNQDKAFSNAFALASAFGKNLSSGDVTINLYPKWRGNTFSVNYYSNYADKSFKNPDNAVGADKNVLVCTGKATQGAYTTYGIRDYSKTSDTYYLGRSGFSATGYWNTKANGSGYNVSEKATFSSAQEVAEAFGKSIANGDASVNVYAQWKRNTLTINYYSNYADRSFSGALNSVGSDKNVIVRTAEAVHGLYTLYGVRDYSKESYGTYLGRTGYTATGYWNTKPNGTGYSISEEASFSTAEEVAQACGKDITHGDATVNLYPQWTQNKLIINYYSNYANQAFSDSLNPVASNGSWWVRQDIVYYWDNCSDGLRNYTDSNDDTYLGRTGYTATGNWITAKEGSGYSVNQDTSFATGQALAQALGADLSSGNATVKIYPEWRNGVDAPTTNIDKTRAAVNETVTFSWNGVQNSNVSCYRVECFDQDEALIFSTEYTASGSREFTISEPGHYTVTAKTVTAEGTVSELNNWQSFTVYDTFTVSLNQNYEGGAISAQAATTDIGLILPEASRDKYVFINWNSDPSGNGTEYNTGDAFYPDSDTILYAIWQKAECLHEETSEKTENYIEPTCTADGSYDLVIFCVDCDEELSRETLTIAASGHSYTADITPPTCTEEGYTIYSCNCGDTYTDDYTQPLGHSFTNYTYNNDATTENDGTETATCDRCDATDTRIKPGTKLESGIISATISTDKAVRGQPVIWTVTTPDDVAWLRFTNNYTTAAGATGSQIISCKYDKANTGTTLISVSDENGTRIWSISMPLTYTGTSASATQIWNIDYKRSGSTVWESVNSTDAQGNTVPYAQEILVVKSADLLVPPTPDYEKYTIVSVTPDTDNGTFTIVTTDDVSKIRIAYTNAETGKVKSFAYQTTSTSIISCESENGLTTWVVKFKFNTPPENDTYSVQARGPAWGEAYNVIAGND